MSEHGNCPSCGANLNSGSIWEHFYNEFQTKGLYLSDERRILTPGEAAIVADEVARSYGATREKGQWGRQIAIYSRGKDKTVAWKCPDCKHEWKR